MQSNHKNTTQMKKQQKKDKHLNSDLVNYRPIKYQQYETIKVLNQKGSKLLVETDVQFVESIQNVCKSRANIINQLISKKDTHISQDECEQIHHLGLLHRKANKINCNSNLTKNDLRKHQYLRSLYCHCGCERFAGVTYPVCYDIQDLSFLGSGILLFFNLLKGLFINFSIVVIIYSFYAIASNFKGDSYLTGSPSDTCDSTYCQFKDRVSSYNLIDANYVVDVLNWMGLASMVVWILLARFLKYYCFYKDKLIDDNLKSSSDFAVKIDNLPMGEYNEEDLYEFLQQVYERKIAKHDAVEPNQILEAILPERKLSMVRQDSNLQPKLPFFEDQISKRVMSEIKDKFTAVVQRKNNRENHFNIRSIQIIYRMDFARKIIQRITDKCTVANKLITKSQDRYLIKQKQNYLEIKKDIIETYETLADMRKKFLNDGFFRKKISTRSAIIQFEDEKSKWMLLDNFGQKNLTFFKRLRQRINQLIFGSSSLIFKGEIPVITRAPEPSDILWQNCERQFSYLRLFGIFCATSVIILISLGAIAGLRAVQFYLKSHTSTDQESSSLVSMKLFNFLTSIVLIIINAILWVLLKFLLDYEYNHTYTEKIISQMNKSSPAMWINTIIIPIVVNYLFYGKYYGADGVAGIVFDYQVTALAVSLPLMVLNPLQIIISLCLKIKCLRNYLIRSRYHKKNQEQDIEIDKIMMQKIYQLYSSPEFVIQEAYIFILSNVMHALFFCELQPFILILVGVQIFCFYWACKFRVLRMCKIPALIDRMVFEGAINEMMLAPIFYGVGAIYNSYVSAKLDEGVSFNFVASSICIGIGLLNYMNPGDFTRKMIEKITNCCECLKKQNIFVDFRMKRKEQQSKLEQQRKQRQFQNVREESGMQPTKIFEEILEEEVKKQEQANGQDSIQNVRLQNYYKNNNSLSLLGFQRAIFGECSTKEVEVQFKNFCESHIQRTIPNAQLFECNSSEQKDSVQKFQQIEVQHRSSAVIIE